MTYFIISNSDGDTIVKEISEVDILAGLKPNEQGDRDYNPERFMSTIKHADTNYWGDGMLLIKGEIIKPKPKEVEIIRVIKEYKL